VAAGDEPRFLHRSIAHAYADVPELGAAGEPECVTANEQSAITQQAHLEAALRRCAAWSEARRQISEAVAGFSASHGDRRLAQSLRQVERAAEVVARQVERLA
jgi:hypothetical protein